MSDEEGRIGIPQRKASQSEKVQVVQKNLGEYIHSTKGITESRIDLHLQGFFQGGAGGAFAPPRNDLSMVENFLRVKQ